MDEYIKRANAIEAVRHAWAKGLEPVQYLEIIPADDVAPVRHGRWGTHSDRPDSLICSVCNCGFDMWKHDPHNFCPNCGARMDGDTDA